MFDSQQKDLVDTIEIYLHRAYSQLTDDPRIVEKVFVDFLDILPKKPSLNRMISRAQFMSRLQKMALLEKKEAIMIALYLEAYQLFNKKTIAHNVARRTLTTSMFKHVDSDNKRQCYDFLICEGMTRYDAIVSTHGRALTFSEAFGFIQS